MRLILSVLAAALAFLGLISPAQARDDLLYVETERQVAVSTDFEIFSLNAYSGFPISRSTERYPKGCRSQKNGQLFDAKVLIVSKAAKISQWLNVKNPTTNLEATIANMPSLARSFCSGVLGDQTMPKSVQFFVVSDKLPRLNGGYFKLFSGSVDYTTKQVWVKRGNQNVPVFRPVGTPRWSIQNSNIVKDSNGDMQILASWIKANPENPLQFLRDREMAAMRQQASKTADFCRRTDPAPASVTYQGQTVRGLSPPQICQLQKSIAGYAEKLSGCLASKPECAQPSAEAVAFTENVVGSSLGVLLANFHYYLERAPRDEIARNDYYYDLFKVFFSSADAREIRGSVTFYPVDSRAKPVSPLRRILTDRSAAYSTDAADSYLAVKIPFSKKYHTSAAYQTERARYATLDRAAQHLTRNPDYDNVGIYLKDLNDKRRIFRPDDMFGIFFMTSALYNEAAKNANQRYASYYREQERLKKLEPAVYLLGALMLGVGLNNIHSGSSANVPINQRKIHTFGYSADDFLIGNPIPTGK
tara:strand:+ start:29322 stop:30914 length:1593 start_codon:yes stop_codon:yes gene_type:complete